ncbi:hypothetical protein GJ744_003261 [Endocarpon pusillum]|uniref:Uncharacterized protein n=1 Tax=Endocarpon pusillum TaxID=364733 RepID=A0A8H7A716_9EURO|nr:hypothetical protein GJ744_003261 [Endocarpon pusillum]
MSYFTGGGKTCGCCDVSLSDGLDLRLHFSGEHGLSRTVPKDAKNLGITRPCPEEDKKQALEDGARD